MEKQPKKSLRITIMLYLLMFAYAIFTVIIGIQLLILVNEFQLTLPQGGIFTVVVNMGCVIGIVISGFFFGKFNKIKLLMSAYLIFSCSLIGVGWSKSFYGYLALLLLIGISMKFLDAAINATVSYLNPVNTGFYINLLHCSFALGSFVGPMLATLLMSKGVGWRNLYVYLGISCFCILVSFFFVQKSTAAGEEKEEKPDEAVPYAALINRRVICLMLILLCYCGHQIGINSWMPAYMQNVLHTNAAVANISLSIFWVGLIVGRFISAILTKFIEEKTILKLGNLCGLILLTAGVLSKNVLLTIIGTGSAGLCAGATIPLVITIGYTWYPKAQGQMSTLLFLCIAGGAVIFPWFMGSVSESGSLFTGMGVNILCLAGSTVCSFLITNGRNKVIC